jgi:hypothetical protein
MADRSAQRRAGSYRWRAQQLVQLAPRLRNQADRQHVLDLVATYRRAADQMEPRSVPSPATHVFAIPTAQLAK